MKTVELLARCGRGVEQHGQRVGADAGPIHAGAAEGGDRFGEECSRLFGPTPLVAPVVVAFAGEGEEGHAQGVARALEMMVGDRSQLIRRVGGAIRIARGQDGEISSSSHSRSPRAGPSACTTCRAEDSFTRPFKVRHQRGPCHSGRPRAAQVLAGPRRVRRLGVAQPFESSLRSSFFASCHHASSCSSGTVPGVRPAS